MQAFPAFGTPAVSRGERLLVLWLAITFLLCVFVALPNELTEPYGPLRRAARSYLRTCGLDQYWRMFVGADWDIPELRITATNRSGVPTDVTRLFLHPGILHRHLLDDHVSLAHLALARGDKPEILASYAQALRARLGPEIREIRFAATFRTARIRPSLGSREPTSVVPLAVYKWE